MNKSVVFSIVFSFFSITANCQLDSIIDELVSDFDTTGLVFIEPGTLMPGDAFDIYREEWFDDPDNTMDSVKYWADTLTGTENIRYQQHHDGIPVEGAYITENYDNGYVNFLIGSVADINSTDIGAPIADSVALDSLLSHISDTTFYTWEDSTMEAELKTQLDDSTATYYPTGELVWELVNPDAYAPYIEPGNHALVWKFRISAIEPEMERTYYVDATNGYVYKWETHIHENGPANVLINGVNNPAVSKVIDTKIGLFNAKLKTDDNNREIETLDYNGGNLQSVKDADDNWGNDHQFATTAHWMSSETWDFYTNVFNWRGIDGNKKKITIWVDEVFDNNPEFDLRNARSVYKRFNNSRIEIGYNSNDEIILALDVMAHEYAHSVDDHSAELIYERESGAVEESYADIYGVVFERYMDPINWNWIIGEDASFTRDISDPHNNTPPRPHTYFGGFYQNTSKSSCPVPRSNLEVNGNDYCFVHTNSSVQNFMFYLLSAGGTGSNDFGNQYNVSGIGIDKAGQIAFHAHTNFVLPFDGFAGSRSAMIASAFSLFGLCTNEYAQVENAWHAVGVGLKSSCVISSVESLKDNKASTLFPNPATNQVDVNLQRLTNARYEIFSLNGSTIVEGELKEGVNQIDITDINSGVYFLRVKGGNYMKVHKLIKSN
jgi:Zn-dependent metalloprotease